MSTMIFFVREVHDKDEELFKVMREEEAEFKFVSELGMTDETYYESSFDPESIAKVFRAFTEKHPEFTIRLDCERDEEHWIEYYQGGKMYTWELHYNIPAFDPSLLE